MGVHSHPSWTSSPSFLLLPLSCRCLLGQARGHSDRPSQMPMAPDCRWARYPCSFLPAPQPLKAAQQPCRETASGPDWTDRSEEPMRGEQRATASLGLSVESWSRSLSCSRCWQISGRAGGGQRGVADREIEKAAAGGGDTLCLASTCSLS